MKEVTFEEYYNAVGGDYLADNTKLNRIYIWQMVRGYYPVIDRNRFIIGLLAERDGYNIISWPTVKKQSKATA